MTYKEMLEEAIREEMIKLAQISRNLVYPEQNSEINYQKTLLKITLLERELHRFS